MKNLKLAMKIGGGFAVLLLLFATVGITNVVFMEGVRQGAVSLNDEYLPEVRILNTLQGEYALAQASMIYYIYTSDEAHYQEGMKRLEAVGVELDKADDLVSQYPDLTALKASIDEIRKGLADYRGAISNIHQSNGVIDAQNALMDQSAGRVEALLTPLIADNRETQEELINADAGGSVLKDQVRKNALLNDIMEFIDDTRIENFKAQARMDDSIMQAALTNFAEIDSLLAEVKGYLYTPQEQEKVASLEAAVDAYRGSMRKVLDEREKRSVDIQKGGAIGQAILDRTEEVTTAGIGRAVEVGEETVSAVLVVTVVLVLGILFALAVGILLAVLITRGITKPIHLSVSFAEAMASGDFSQKLEIQQSDEVGQLASALNKMVESLGVMIGDVVNGVQTLSSSASELSSISGELSTGAEGTTQRTNSVASAAEQLNVNTESVAGSMEQASANLTNVASAAEEMNATIGEITSNTEKARTTTEEAVHQTQGVSERMNALGEAAKEIGKVTEVITSISDQTNLLALNATIEAARAGSAGKGFAVVAGEIKELAQQTSEATEDIREKIKDIQNSTGASVTDMESIKTIVQDVNEIVTTIASAIEEQAATTRDIAENISQASAGVQDATDRAAQNAEGIKDISSEVAEVSHAAGEISSSSEQLDTSAQELSELSERLRTLTEQFTL